MHTHTGDSLQLSNATVVMYIVEWVVWGGGGYIAIFLSGMDVMNVDISHEFLTPLHQEWFPVRLFVLAKGKEWHAIS